MFSPPLAKSTNIIICIPPICILFGSLHPPLGIINFKKTSVLLINFPLTYPNVNFSLPFWHARRAEIYFNSI
jgi:hypothetical protein